MMSDLHTCTLAILIWPVIRIRHRNSLCVFGPVDMINGMNTMTNLKTNLQVYKSLYMLLVMFHVCKNNVVWVFLMQLQMLSWTISELV